MFQTCRLNFLCNRRPAAPVKRVGSPTRTPPECVAVQREVCPGGVSGASRGLLDDVRTPLEKQMGAADIPHGTSGVRSELHRAQTPTVLDHSRTLLQRDPKSSTPATCSTMLLPVSSQMSTRKAKCVLVFMDQSHSTCPGPLLFIPHVVASRSLPRLL